MKISYHKERLSLLLEQPWELGPVESRDGAKGMNLSTISKVKASEKRDVGNFLYFLEEAGKVAWG